MDGPTLAELRRRYEETTDAETRTRYQILLLSLRGQTSGEIAQMVLRSQDTVVRVLKRFVAGGLDAVPRRTPPGRERRVTAAWEAELLRVIELDPHEVGQDTANWTTQRLADYLGQHTGVQVTEETVRVYFHAHDYVCKRPTWTDVGARPRRRPITWETRGSVEVLLAGATAPAPLPVRGLVESDLWSQLPANLSELLTLLPGADLYLQDEMQVAFHPPLTRQWCRKGRRGQRLVEAPGDNRYPSTALAWWTGVMAGSLRDAPLKCDVAQVRAAVTRSKQRGRLAIVIADNLRTHTSDGSLLVRSLRSRVQGPVVLSVYPRL